LVSKEFNVTKLSIKHNSNYNKCYIQNDNSNVRVYSEIISVKVNQKYDKFKS